MIEHQLKTNEKYIPFYIIFQVLKVLLMKIWKIQPSDFLFLVVVISFYITRHYFSELFRASFNIIWKSDFIMNFPFLTDSSHPSPLLKPSKSAKHHERFLLMLPYKAVMFFIIKSITRSLIIFKKPRKVTNDVFNHYMFVHTFQWTSSECLTNFTITVKVAMVTYIYYENI